MVRVVLDHGEDDLAAEGRGRTACIWRRRGGEGSGAWGLERSNVWSLFGKAELVVLDDMPFHGGVREKGPERYGGRW